MRALAIVMLSLVLGACGGGDAASRAYGDLTKQDREAMVSLQSAIIEFSTGFSRLQSAFESEDLQAARAEIDGLAAPLDRADATTLEFDNGNLRSTFQDYVTKARTMVSAFDRWLAYWEDDSAARDQALEDQMSTAMEQAARDFRAADQAVVNRLLDNASPEQRDQIREAAKKAQAGGR